MLMWRMWVKLSQENEECLMLAVCYIPLESSSRGSRAKETFQLLAEQVAKFGSQCPLIICGDFNARCGKMVWIVKECHQGRWLM